MNYLEEVLQDKNISYTINPNNPSEVTFRCIGGTHEDKNPSMSFNIEKGLFNCFSCGLKGTTQQFFEMLGVIAPDKLSSKQSIRIDRLKAKISELSNSDIELPEPRLPVTFSFKGISAKTMINFEAFTTTSLGFEDYICVPVYQQRKLRFVEGRHIHPVTEPNIPKYLRKPARASVSDVLFPLDKVKDFSEVILVEGLYDALSLHDLGFENALCIFGTQNFNSTKARLLDELNCRRVTILMDGDSSGRTAAKKIKSLLDSRYIESKIVDLPEGEDPGNFNEYTVNLYLT